MSFQNNMAKESYPYKIIWSGYAPSSPHKVSKSCTTPMKIKQLFHTCYVLKTFSTLMQYMSVSHGYSTIGGIECGGGCKTKRRRWSHRLGVSKGYGDAH